MSGLLKYKPNLLDIFDLFDSLETKTTNRKTSIYRTQDNVVLEYNLAGFKRDEISVTLNKQKNLLEIVAETNREDRPRLLESKISYKLDTSGYEIDEGNISTTFEDGLLILKLRQKTEKSREIKIF